MLKTLRQNTKPIMLIVVICFVGMIIFSWGAGITGRKSSILGKGIIGKVNGKKIKIEDFQRELTSMRDLYGKAEWNADNERLLREEAWNKMVNDILFDQEIKKHRITVSDNEIVSYISMFPPNWVQQIEFFHTDGNFDWTKYRSFFTNPESVNDPVKLRIIAYLEHYARMNLPRQKLMSQLMTTVHITDEDIRSEFYDRNDKREIEYTYIMKSLFRSLPFEPTEEEIKHYYDQNPESFKSPERRMMDIIFLSYAPTPEDEAKIDQRAKDIVQFARAPNADFARLARENSDDESSSNSDGDLGFIKPGTFSGKYRQIEQVAFSMNKGDVSDIIKIEDDDGSAWHILKVTDTKTEDEVYQVKLSMIVIKIDASRKTLDDRRDTLNEIEEAVIDDPDLFASEAESHSIQIKQTQLFMQDDSFLSNVGENCKELIKVVFTKKEGNIIGPYQNKYGMFLFRLSRIEESGLMHFDLAKKDVIDQIKNERSNSLAYKHIDTFLRRLNEGASFSEAAVFDSLVTHIEPEEPVSRTSTIPGMGSRSPFATVIFKLQNVNDITEIVELEIAYVVGRIKAILPPDEEKYAEEKEKIQQELKNQRQNEIVQKWLDEIRKKAKIKDNRLAFYGI